MRWRTLIFCSLVFTAAASPLRISEFSAGGHQGLKDEDLETPDWIEIENVSEKVVELGDWFLSDDSNSARKWQFPNTNLSAGSFLVIFASGKNRTNHALHTNFKLKAESGWVLLSAPAGVVSVVSNYPPQVAGISFGISSGRSEGKSAYTYLSAATPGRSNAGAITRGPRVHSVKHSPLNVVSTNEPIVVTAEVRSDTKVSGVTLNYRVMFRGEQTLPMRDDGKSYDGSANDGVYGAAIPAGVARAGEMIRYSVTARDGEGNSSRWPLFAKRAGYSAYEGIVVASERGDSKLPVFQFFSATPLQASSSVALFHAGEFYDNVQISEHGQITRMFPKPGFNLDFPFDHRFRYRTNVARVSDLKILANFPDKSKIRNTLAYEMSAAAGSIAHFAYPVRMEENGRFFCVAEVVEDGDDRWLERVGLDPHGALYKMYGNLFEFTEAEKKTRKDEGFGDIAALAASLSEHRPLAERVAYAIDHLNIPQCISYLVAMAVISSGDHGHKNYYLYHDTRRTGEWAVLPWDVDLSLGRNWTKTYFDERIYSDNPLTLYRAGRKDQGRNPLYNILFEHPPFRQMYLRRLRTVVDELFEPVAPDQRSRIEQRILELMDMIDPPGVGKSDADLDNERWPGWGTTRNAREEGARIIMEYIPARREFLLKRATLHGDRLPEAQSNEAMIHLAEIREDIATGGFIRVENPNRFAVDVSTWVIRGRGIEHSFRPGTVIPANGSLSLVGNVQSYRSSPQFKPGVEFVQGHWQGVLVRDGEIEVRNQHGRAKKW
ncbi:MAG TPA: CotH kinase family protein [Verrucomicrobiae bacterium]